MPSEPLTQVIIPFRDRGHDSLRSANLGCTLAHWETFEDPIVVSDGRLGDQQFNRSAAYNRGVSLAAKHIGAAPDVYIFAEGDLIVEPLQIGEGVRLALESPGLVVPFSEYHYLTPESSEKVRYGLTDPADADVNWKMVNGRSIGAINIVSHRTMEMLGCWDEYFEGSWYDDNAMAIAFELCTGNDVRFVQGTAYHLYHLPGWKGDHLTAEDEAATARNRQRLDLYRAAAATKNVALVRKLLRESTAHV